MVVVLDQVAVGRLDGENPAKRRISPVATRFPMERPTLHRGRLRFA
jgi:hypothetical protein